MWKWHFFRYFDKSDEYSCFRNRRKIGMTFVFKIVWSEYGRHVIQTFFNLQIIFGEFRFGRSFCFFFLVSNKTKIISFPSGMETVKPPEEGAHCCNALAEVSTDDVWVPALSWRFSCNFSFVSRSFIMNCIFSSLPCFLLLIFLGPAILQHFRYDHLLLLFLSQLHYSSRWCLHRWFSLLSSALSMLVTRCPLQLSIP